ncbi:hypothetical protein [Actinomadura madurae]|uniref:hypothetical protein n=1 Tax=Actinomadura madurae TaxID=1993 RepID=UPI0020D2581C|nr:hypothetical protein [Actinomadura madurae]MCP9968808.1 hypothetical protein [Actinomadura madurae]MCP9981284.1 hypothetical protein [Actinomadura madurae]
MIPFEDLLWVIFYAAAAAFVVAGLALGVLYALRGHSVATQLIVVGAATVLATISGILVISFMMLLNDHDRSVVLAVVTSAGLVAMAVSVLLGRRLVAANRVLVEAVRAGRFRRPPPTSPPSWPSCPASWRPPTTGWPPRTSASRPSKRAAASWSRG